MADLQTDLNVAPFYDDYDENKQYYRILFRPSTAVQARELTQLQTILQKQISRFGDSIYKDGSIVEGCNFTQYPNIPQVRFKDSNTSTLDFTVITLGNSDTANNVTHLANSHLLVSNTSGLRAAVFEAKVGAESAVDAGSFDTNRAYVIYLNSGNNLGTQVSTFSTTSEQIDVYSSTQDKLGPLSSSNYLGSVYTLTSNSSVNALSVGHGIHIGQGIIYQKGFFIKSNPGNFIIKEHSSNVAGIKVGFSTAEYIVKPAEDPSLYDNSIGSPNYSAPGAYRLKLVPSLVSYDSSNTQVTIPTGFLPVVDFSGATSAAPVLTAQDPVYSKIGEAIAQRTKEESGDYIVKPFQVNVEASGNPNTFFYTLSPGIAYIDGYRVEYEAPRRIEVPRGVTSQDLLNEIATVNFGNYIFVNDVAGIFDIGGLQSVTIYNAKQEVLSKNITASSPLGTAVGTATVRAFKFYSGTKGTPSAQYRLYLTNVRMTTGYSFATDAKSFYVDGTYGKVFADIVLTNGKAQIQGNLSNLIYDTGLTGIKRLTSNSGVNGTSYIYRDTSSAENLTRTGGKATATFTLGSDRYNYGVGTIDDIAAENINIFFNTDVTANLFSSTVYPGSIGGVSNSTCSNVTVGSVNAGFDTILQTGHNIKLYSTATGTTYHTITAVNGANSITLTPNISATAIPGPGTISLYRFFKKGSLVDFTGSGNTITFAQVSGVVTQMSVDIAIDPDTATTYSIRAQAPILRTSAVPIKKDVKKDRYVNINCASHPAGSTGPWSLGLPDVYKVTSVYYGAGFGNTYPDKVDWFNFDNGQTDNYYGLAQISVKPQYKSQITSATRLTVKLNHLSPNITSSQATFMSVDSYPIDDANPANTVAIATAEIPVYRDLSGGIYDLRNFIDVRPIITNTAVSSTTAVGATINPANNVTTFYTPAFPAAIEPDSNFEYNAEFYLPRYDALLITKDGNMIVKSGTPSFNPKQPTLNNSGMKVADIYVPPYPSLTFTEAE